ncbi:hypothetical protein K432DRAFT_402857 [Lepidopterella palustris CBS 459.81]|uniref:Response regulatory domain-containing protein n=1 Tax=Lepidopterella palustris CBS 459.81 TaxID=1314670 RepID=A0A8E2JHT4_9PEZI|nr:hypothetical protein K432DRAFT_402857 [Lepidopterella palustris CBS 459.81]
MGDLKSRLNNARTKLLRRGSATSSRSNGSSAASGEKSALPTVHQPRLSASLTKLPEISSQQAGSAEDDIEYDNKALSKSEDLIREGELQGGFQNNPPSFETIADRRTESLNSKDPQTFENSITELPPPCEPARPAITLEEPTPIPIPAHLEGLPTAQLGPENNSQERDIASPLRLPPRFFNPRQGTSGAVRRQSLVTTSNARIIETLLEPENPLASAGVRASQDYFSTELSAFDAGMLHRKIWVKRPNASATLVQVREDDLVDDVRGMILKKYANSLGKNFDAPDVILRIFPRDTSQKTGDRVLGPEEEMCRTLDAYYPDGQTVNEALVIDVPQRRTPKPSPRAVQHGIPYYYDESRPIENAAEYFPPMPVVNPSPTALTTASHDSRASLSHAAHERSISVLSTGQLPPLPSPGGTRRLHYARPKYPRQNAVSPTALTSSGITASSSRPSCRPRHDSNASDTKHPAPPAPPLPTPPAPEVPVTKANSSPPAPRVSSPRPTKSRKRQKPPPEAPSLPAGLLDGSVPPINVLIVEDNIINLRVLGAFMERLKVRWQRAMNGREAVTKWRAGGFHLVLMDIQLPIMNGLEATKEIRRLERVNSIGVFSSASNETPDLLGRDGEGGKEIKEEDKLGDGLLFKSPVIIVALTASSLQSDRHEALAAGCNDFLTKPVNFVWLERKVKEWGCMQALIDFDGWRKWKDFAAQSDSSKGTSKMSSSFSITASNKSKPSVTLSPSSTATPVGNMKGGNGTGPNGASAGAKAKKKEEDKKKRESVGMGVPVVEEKESESPSPEADSSGSLT